VMGMTVERADRDACSRSWEAGRQGFRLRARAPPPLDLQVRFRACQV